MDAIDFGLTTEEVNMPNQLYGSFELLIMCQEICTIFGWNYLNCSIQKDSQKQKSRIDKERNIFETVANGWISSKILKDMTCNTTTNLTNNCVTIAWK